ncbi:MAG: hypothetical protein WCO84_08330 [bacterium]
MGWIRQASPADFITNDLWDKESGYYDDVIYHKGFRMFNEWGHVMHCSSAIVAIKPVSMWYGK